MASGSRVRRLVLSQGWRLRERQPGSPLAGTEVEDAASLNGPGWIGVPAMPAMVHDVLRARGDLPDPWLPGEAVRQAWVARRDWVYALTFDAPGLPAGGRARLRFAGVDTIAEAYLNGAPVARHANAFTPFSADVTGVLGPGANTLVLHVRSIFDPASPDAAPLRFVHGDPTRPVRRTRYRHDNYLGPQPYFHVCGPWGDVVLELTAVAEMEPADVAVEVSEDLSRAVVRVMAGGWARPGCALRLRATLLGPDGHSRLAVEEAELAPAAPRRDAWAATLNLDVARPALWWPRGHGEQPLHELRIEMLAEGGLVQEETRRIGFRRIEMPQPMQFRVNGRRVRLWGANWVSPDWTTEVWNAGRAEALLDIAEHSNFNCLRVWGQVAPPGPSFYESCDRRGMLAQ